MTVEMILIMRDHLSKCALIQMAVWAFKNIRPDWRDGDPFPLTT